MQNSIPVNGEGEESPFFCHSEPKAKNLHRRPFGLRLRVTYEKKGVTYEKKG